MRDTNNVHLLGAKAQSAAISRKGKPGISPQCVRLSFHPSGIFRRTKLYFLTYADDSGQHLSAMSAEFFDREDVNGSP